MAIRPRPAPALLRATLLLTAAAVLAPAWAEKPEWAGGGKPGRHEQHEPNDKGKKQGKHEKHGQPEGRRGSGPAQGAYFQDAQRVAVRDYYGSEFRRGHCPPGLAKKHNGCLPPGQAKKWVVGRPLPREVVWYPVPAPLVVQLGVPPAGYKYVRVAADILLIAVGTSMVVDGISGLLGS